jgi:KipI family sensor histidine kinase inhibitor
MIGFTPGFCYLGGLDRRLWTPRRETPRTSLPAGAVGIAESQTGMYPIESPGGWQIIGRTPLRLFAPARESPFLYEPGNRIRFVPIGEDEFQRLREREEVS